jgi:CheY-like chemotaxis protein
VAPQHLSIHGALFLAYVHPADRFSTEVFLDTALREGTPYVATYRWIRPDSNEVRFIHCRATREPGTSLFKGILVDITAEAPKLRSGGDLALGIGDLLRHLALPGIALDPELTVLSVNLQPHHPPLSLGVSDLDYEKLRPGASLLACVSSDESRSHLQGTLEKLLVPGATPFSCNVDGFETIGHPLQADGMSHGVVIYTLDKRNERRALEQVSALEHELQLIHSMRTFRPRVAASIQEIAGYGALITRHSRSNPLLAAISDSLLHSIRELAATTDQLHAAPSKSSLLPKHHSRRRKGSSPLVFSRNTSAQVVFTSLSPRCATSHALALRDSGIPCATASLDEQDLTTLIRTAQRIAVLILDTPINERECASLIRRIKRTAPHLHIVCLASSDPGTHTTLLRAGAVTVLSKPASIREVEKTVRTLLTLRETQLSAESLMPR